MLLATIVKGKLLKNSQIIDLIIDLKYKCSQSEIEIVDKLNLSQSDYQAINKINFKEIISCNDLADRMCLSLSRISRIIENLVKKDLITREESKDDRRIKLVALTENGFKIKKEIERYKKDCEKKITKAFNESEIKSLELKIKKLIEVL